MNKEGFGYINWWGFSPAIDLLQLYDDQILNLKENETQELTLNILLVNSGDQRHILKTLASRNKLFKNRKLSIRFYIYENQLELYARDLLLLSFAFEHPNQMSVQEKSELFLELYGNLLIREYTSQILIEKANEFIKYITDLDYLKNTNLNMFDLNQLKYKERDYLEGIFKFWRTQKQEQKSLDPHFPATKCWDVRLRNYFGTRYDSRKNPYE